MYLNETRQMGALNGKTGIDSNASVAVNGEGVSG